MSHWCCPKRRRAKHGALTWPIRELDDRRGCLISLVEIPDSWEPLNPSPQI